QLSHTEEIPAAWRFIWENLQEWPVIYFDGRTTVCAWSDQAIRPTDRHEWWQKAAPDYHKLAYSREAVQAPEAIEWPHDRYESTLELYGHPAARRPLEADMANGLIRYAYGVQREYSFEDRKHAVEVATGALEAALVARGFGAASPVEFTSMLEAQALVGTTEKRDGQ